MFDIAETSKQGTAVRHVPTARSGKLAEDNDSKKTSLAVDFADGVRETVFKHDLRVDLSGSTWVLTGR